MKPIHSDTLLDVEDVRALPRQIVRTCWYGNTLAQPLEWCVALDAAMLWCFWKVPGNGWCDPSHVSGDFIEGLWERDVAEIFLLTGAGLHAEGYREYNVSPRGAWWSASFDSYRVRSAVQRVSVAPRVETWLTTVPGSDVTEAAWEAVLGVPRSELGPMDPSGEIRIHVAAIIHKPEQRFISSRPLADIPPDFHRIECFE